MEKKLKLLCWIWLRKNAEIENKVPGMISPPHEPNNIYTRARNWEVRQISLYILSKLGNYIQIRKKSVNRALKPLKVLFKLCVLRSLNLWIMC